MHNHKTVNLSSFAPEGQLGQMFAKAKFYNTINKQLLKLLPTTLKTLSLCMIDGDTAYFISPNQAQAFRAKQQQKQLIDILQSIDGIATIQKIKVNVKI